MGLFDWVGNLLGFNSKQPDYTAAANAQGAANKETALTQALLNNPNMITPFGNQTYSPYVEGERSTLTQTLSPAEQAKLDQANAIQGKTLDILGGNLGNINKALTGDFTLPGSAPTDYDPRYAPTDQVPTNLDFSGAPGMPTASPEVLQQVIDAMYGSGAQYLDPQYARSEDQLRSRLANQGIMSGSEVAGAGGNPAYNNEMDKFNEAKRKDYSDLRMSSILGGQDAMSNLYNLALSGRQQGVNEAKDIGAFKQAGIIDQANIASNQAGIAQSGRAQNLNELTAAKTMPLNQINSILSGGQINTPTFQPTAPTSITPAPIFDAAKTTGLASAADASRKANFWGQIAGAGATAYRNSDRRLKTNIRRIGTRYGLPWYEFDILGSHREGVMADEAPAHAVSVGPCGFLMVDYGRL
jgi:hypothetical protein